MASQPMGNILQVHAELFVRIKVNSENTMPVEVRKVCEFLSMLKRGIKIIKATKESLETDDDDKEDLPECIEAEKDLAECLEIERFWVTYLQSKQQICPKAVTAAD